MYSNSTAGFNNITIGSGATDIIYLNGTVVMPYTMPSFFSQW